MTLFLGKLLGLYLIAISIGLLLGKRRALAALDEMARSGAWMLFTGLVATAAGVALTLARDVFSGGGLTIAVTLVGWAVLLKGLALLIAPPSALAEVHKSVISERYFSVCMGAVLALGLWMTWEAFSG